MDLNDDFISAKISEQNKDYNTIKKLDFSGNQIEDWGDPESYIKKIVPLNILDLKQNYIETIFPDIQILDSLKILNLRENLIIRVDNLAGHNSLEELDLSSNRIKTLDGLEDLPKLRILRISGNFLIRMDGLDLPLLKVLDLSNNEISSLEGLENLSSLEEIYMSKNRLNDIDYLMVLQVGTLKIMDFSFNLLSLGYIDQLCEVLKGLKSLERVTFVGNEVAFNKLYRMKISQFYNLTHLDDLEIKPYARNLLRETENGDEIDKLIQKSKDEFLSRIRTEEELKEGVIQMLERQKRQIETHFNQYKVDMEEEQLNFIKWSKEVKHNLGDRSKDVLIRNWKNQLEKQERQRLLARNRAREEQKRQQQMLLDRKLALTQFNQKLYEISIQKPDLWRELKRLEYDKVKQEQGPNFKKEENNDRRNSQQSKSRLEFEDFEQDMQFNNARDVNVELLDKELDSLRKEEEKAANAIGKQARVRFNIGEPAKEQESFVDEYLDLMDKQGALNAKYEPDYTIREESGEYSGQKSISNGVDWYQDGKVTKMNLAPSQDNSFRMSRNGSRVLSSNQVSAWDLSNKNYS